MVVPEKSSHSPSLGEGAMQANTSPETPKETQKQRCRPAKPPAPPNRHSHLSLRGWGVMVPYTQKPGQLPWILDGSKGRGPKSHAKCPV